VDRRRLDRLVGVDADACRFGLMMRIRASRLNPRRVR
jgi:hypothetical protein